MVDSATTQSWLDRLSLLCGRILAGVLALLGAGLFVAGLFVTVVLRQDTPIDLPEFVPVHPLGTAAAFAGGAFLVCLIALRGVRRGGQGAPRTLRGVLVPGRCFLVCASFAACLCCFLLWAIRGLPTNDAKILDGVVQEFMAGDYRDLSEGYLTIYPFQLSYCLILEALVRLFGPGRFLVSQILNVLSILLSLFFLYEIAWELSWDRAVCELCALLGLGCLPLYVYCTFIYNDIWSLAPLFGGFWLLLRFFREGSLASGVGAALLTGLSFWLKSNGTIALVAMGILLLLRALRAFAAAERGRAAKQLAVLFLILAVSGGLRWSVNAYYEARSGLPIPGGVPAAAYIAMGMEVADGKYGWYNGDNAAYLRDAGGDPDRASAAAAEEIRARARNLLSYPKGLIKFYGMKYLSQWADPTAVSLREQELTGLHQEGRPRAAAWLTYGGGYRLLQAGMHLFHLLLYFFAAAACAVIALGGRDPGEARRDGIFLILLFVFGGMLFHQLWEASGRYTLRYVVTLLPVAAMGAREVCSLRLSLRKGGNGAVHDCAVTRKE